MLNLRMLYILIDQRSVKTYLAIVTGVGFGVLLDILILLNLSLVLGQWITLAIVTALTALGIAAVYPHVRNTSRRLVEIVDEGKFESDILSRYIATLVAAGFIVVPGLFNTVVGLVLLIRPVSIRAGRAISQLTGIDWREAYEYLRLDRIVHEDIDS